MRCHAALLSYSGRCTQDAEPGERYCKRCAGRLAPANSTRIKDRYPDDHDPVRFEHRGTDGDG